MNITLIGYMGSGKSTIAKMLAVELGLNYFDLDIEIEKRRDSTISDIIHSKGELFFRKLERDVLHEILQQENFVLSAGGGTPCYYNNIDVINQNSISVYLQLGVIELFERLDQNKRERPLIAHLDGLALKEYIGKHLLERSSFYEKAILCVNASSKGKEELTKHIIDNIHE